MEQFYERKEISKETVELKITIPKDSFKDSYNILLKDHLKDTSVKGFRKGKVPTDLLESDLKGELKIETLDKLAPLYINTAIQKESIEPIAPPTYKDLPKLEDDKDVVFTIEITVLPEFKLGNMKKVKIEKEEAKITKAEIDTAIDEIQKNRETKTKEVNDKWAVEIAEMLKIEKVKDLESLKKYIKEALKEQKEHMLLHKREEDALVQAISLSKIEIPLPAVKFEASERERSFIYDMQQRGIKPEEFIKTQNLTIEKMRELWEKDAREALETDVFLKIYKKENKISVSEADLNERIEQIKKSAPKDRDTSVYDDPKWREYVHSVYEKEKAFDHFRKEVFGDTHKD